MKTYQKTLISILIGLIAFPAVTLGGSFVVSLIQGKTPAEAVQILAEQLDILIGRVETVEIKQIKQEQTTSDIQSVIDQQQGIIDQQKTLIEQLQSEISTNKACSDMYRYFKSDANAEYFYQEALKYQQIHGIDDPQALEWLNEYQLYLQAKQNCNSLFR